MSVVSAGKQTVTKIGDRVREIVQRARDRWPVVDHGARAGAHYGEVLGSQLAAGVTYFGFLSFFPLIALGFAVVGYVVAYVPEAGDALTRALSEFLPGLVGDGKGQINVEQIASAKTGAGIIGLVGLLYSGLGAISALRTALHGVFHPGVKEEQRNFVVGKAMDLVVLFVVGLVAVVSVSVGSLVTAMTGQVVGWLGLSGVPGSGLVLWLLGTVVGIGTSMLAFFTTYRLLPKNAGRSRDLMAGALIAAIGFEVLKQLAGIVLGQVTSNALYGAFAVMVALLVWINYTSRLAVLGATWAATAPARATGEATDETGDEHSGNEAAGPSSSDAAQPVSAERAGDEREAERESAARAGAEPASTQHVGDGPVTGERESTERGSAARAGAEPASTQQVGDGPVTGERETTERGSAARPGAEPVTSADAGDASAERLEGSEPEAEERQQPVPATRGRRFGHALGRRIGGVLGRRHRHRGARHRGARREHTG